MEIADTPPETAPATPPCKHEFVRIYQRKLKGLERRLVSTKAYLPVGFKMADFGHLSEGSFCFCTKCRARLFPKRTAADKLQARLDNKAKLAAAMETKDIDPDEDDAIDSSVDDFVSGLLSEDANGEEESNKNSGVAISVEELEIVPAELDDLSETSAEIEDDDEGDEL